MPEFSHPTDQTLREALLRRVEIFVSRTGKSKKHIGIEAVGNSNAVYAIIDKGKNFEINTYSRLMEWLEENTPGGTR